MPEFYMTFARKIIKIPEFYVIYARKIDKMPEFYTIFLFFFCLEGRGNCLPAPPPPPPPPPVSYAYGQGSNDALGNKRVNWICREENIILNVYVYYLHQSTSVSHASVKLLLITVNVKREIQRIVFYKKILSFF